MIARHGGEYLVPQRLQHLDHELLLFPRTERLLEDVGYARPGAKIEEVSHRHTVGILLLLDVLTEGRPRLGVVFGSSQMHVSYGIYNDIRPLREAVRYKGKIRQHDYAL